MIFHVGFFYQLILCDAPQLIRNIPFGIITLKRIFNVIFCKNVQLTYKIYQFHEAYRKAFFFFFSFLKLFFVLICIIFVVHLTQYYESSMKRIFQKRKIRLQQLNALFISIYSEINKFHSSNFYSSTFDYASSEIQFFS